MNPIKFNVSAISLIAIGFITLMYLIPGVSESVLSNFDPGNKAKKTSTQTSAACKDCKQIKHMTYPPTGLQTPIDSFQSPTTTGNLYLDNRTVPIAGNRKNADAPDSALSANTMLSGNINRPTGSAASPQFFSMRGTQQIRNIPVKDDPGALQALRHAQVEEAPTIDNSTSKSVVSNYYKGLTDQQEKVAYLSQIAQSGHPDTGAILQVLFNQETDPLVQQEILTLATENSNPANLIEKALRPDQPTDVRFAALFYAQEFVPELVNQYTNDPLIGNDAQSMLANLK